jgi:hypothetical protein
MAFYDFPFEPYAPVRRQLLVLLREVNAVRRQAGFQVLPIDVLPLRRRIVKPFGDDGAMKPMPTRQLDLLSSINVAEITGRSV